MTQILPLSFPTKMPTGCVNCPYNSIGQGFVPDHVPTKPKIAFLGDFVSENDMTQRNPFIDSTGRMFFHQMLEPLGLTRNDVILSNVIRCRPPEGMYPIGDLRKNAEKMCRWADSKHRISIDDDSVGLVEGGLNSFNPNLAILTVHPSFVNRTWSILRVAKKDIEKAVRFVDKGYRVLVLLGDKAQSLIFPDLEGGILKWRGHFAPVNWGKIQERFK